MEPNRGCAEQAALENGRNDDVLHLAEHVIEDQTAEIAEMERLLREL